jgi:predicted PurR-regulated permease PerM
MPLIANSLKNLSAALITAALIIAAIVLGRDILVPLALAGISCFVLVPMVRWLKRWCVPSGVAESLVLFAVIALLSAASYGLSSQLLSLAAQLPQYRTNVLDKVRSVVGTSMPSGLVGRAIDAVESYQEMLNQELRLGTDAASPTAPPNPESPAQTADQKPENKVQVIKEQSDSSTWYGLRILAEPLAQAALTFLFVLFLLMQYKDLRDRVVRVFGVDNMTETTAAMSDAGDRLTALFTGQALLNASFGVVVTCVLLVLGVPNAPLWGVVAFVMRFVPFVGSYIAAVPPVLLAAAVDPGWTKAISTLALFVIGEPIMGQVLEPLVLGRRAGLSPFAMVVSTSFWTLAWGPVGLVLAAPMTLVLVVLGKYIPDLAFITVLLGDEPPLSVEQDLYHRFLSGDAHAAMTQIEEAEEENSSEAVLDTLVFPALKLAARDRRRGRLDGESTEELESTIEEVIARSAQSKMPEDAEVLFVPVRGRFDEMAALFAVAVANRKRAESARALGGSGLTALALLGDAPDVRQVALITVVGLPENLIRIMIERARKLFPNARDALLDLARGRGNFSETGASADAAETFGTISDFLAVLNSNQVDPIPPLPLAAATTRGVEASAT